MVVMLDFLRKLGLNKYEANAYLILLRGPNTAFLISKESNVPFGRIYDCLNSLENKGFVEVVPSKPKKYKAVNPETAMNGLIDDELNNFEKLRESIKSEVSKLKMVEKTEDVVSVSAGKANFAKQVREHFNYENEYVATSEDFNIENWYPSLQRQFTKDPSKRFILIDKDKTGIEKIKELKNLKLNMKHYPLENVRFIISDKELITISIQEEKKEWINIQIRNKTLGKALTKLLKTAWEAAEKV